MSVMLRNLEWVDPRRRSAASTSVYAATRSAVETMTAILAKELRGRNITVNVVAPGPVAMDVFLTGKSQELVDRMAKMNPMECLGTPEDIASTVAFLVVPKADGSMPRCRAPMAAWSDQGPFSHVSISALISRG